MTSFDGATITAIDGISYTHLMLGPRPLQEELYVKLELENMHQWVIQILTELPPAKIVAGSILSRFGYNISFSDLKWLTGHYNLVSLTFHAHFLSIHVGPHYHDLSKCQFSKQDWILSTSHQGLMQLHQKEIVRICTFASSSKLVNFRADFFQNST